MICNIFYSPPKSLEMLQHISYFYFKTFGQINLGHIAIFSDVSVSTELHIQTF